MILTIVALTTVQACVSQKTRKLYGPEKPFVKLRSAYIVKLVFSYVVKGIKIKVTAKFRDTEHLRFEDTKRIMSPEKFRVFWNILIFFVHKDFDETSCLFAKYYMLQ